MRDLLKHAAAVIGRQIKVLFLCLAVGAFLILTAMGILLVNSAWEEPAQMVSTLGLRVLILGYPVYFFYCVIRYCVKKKNE